ncbi:HAD family hydrolase [Alloscardovia macacae]|uniref:Haloacid dehalogenase n=1 Tax=Alloscardovia macacae TaxID=1160091 RepID=A0A261F6Y2_9BIFI|nr:HAD family phosphatase [Alloscardovia macacae]OZG54825.1 haloacid dehalogenase [Alloscardovia macacae]
MANSELQGGLADGRANADGNADGTVKQSDRLPAAVLWDMDGTLINSEPYWGESEAQLLARAGKVWDPEVAGTLQGSSLAFVADFMLKQAGVPGMSAQDVIDFMVAYVYRKEVEALPWTNGVYSVLEMLRDAGVPQYLVTSSPKPMARNLVEQAPAGAFAGYVCNETPVEHKPSPQPYLYAASQLGVDIADCLIFEDSVPGLTAAGASGASWVSVTGYSSIDARELGLASQFIRDYTGLTLEDIAGFLGK